MNQKDLDVIQNRLGYSFRNIKLLIQAFIKASDANQVVNYDVLEFYGDKILGFIVSKKLCSENSKLSIKENFLSAMSPGQLTSEFVKYTNNGFLSARIEKIGFVPFLIKNRYQKLHSISTKTQGDLFEAILGAVAVDSDWDAKILEKVCLRMLTAEFDDDVGENDILAVTEAHNLGQVDFYEDDGFDGKTFTVRLSALRREFSATSKKIKIAKSTACRKTLDYLNFVLNERLPDSLTSSDKLNMLSRMKIIPEVNYHQYMKENTSEEEWITECSIEGFDKKISEKGRHLSVSQENAAKKMLDFIFCLIPSTPISRAETKKKPKKEMKLPDSEKEAKKVIDEENLDFVSRVYNMAKRNEIERPDFIFTDGESDFECRTVINGSEYKAVASSRKLAKQEVCKMFLDDFARIKELYFV